MFVLDVKIKKENVSFFHFKSLAMCKLFFLNVINIFLQSKWIKEFGSENQAYFLWK